MKNFYKKIQTIRSVLKMLLLGCFMFVGSIAYTYGQTAFVTTDKPDYLVNQEVKITGTGFQSSEKVILTITDFITKAEILSFWVFCQPDGSFTASMILVNSDKIHKLIARGETSGRTAQVLYNNLPLINFTGSGIPDFERIYINLQYTDRHNLSIERGVNFTLGPNNPLPDIPCYPGTTFNYSEVKTCDFGIIVGPIPENCYGFFRWNTGKWFYRDL